ncbi:MAG: GDP-mannose 4,6-dehydratase [Candidatus Beckwithbacteria bacterium]|nr:GDP-mannose 4,6-dehydratase [Candidatus Beckwithbacteria bacterium]
MKPIAFITGITGQDGSYLAEFLLQKNYQVVGMVSPKNDIGKQNIKSIESSLTLETGDLLDYESLYRIITRFKPQEIYNLGGITFLPASWDKATLTLDVNALGVTRLLEIIRDFSPQTRFYQATSAKIFGVPAEVPQTEATPLRPVDPYSVSKACSHYLVKNFREHFKLFTVSGILYNHESERRGPEFVTRKITLAAAKIKLNLEKNLTLGNLDARQDWGYAPDYVEAMWLMLQQDKADDYIIASGESHSVRDVAEIAFGYLGLDFNKFIVIDKKIIRHAEARELLGDSSKARKILGWRPRVGFKDMIIKMVENDLKLLKEGKYEN